MHRQVIAVYPGTFDPMTLGHSDVVRRAVELFDVIIVAVAAGHHKKTMFSLQERMDMVQEVVAPLPQVRVESFSGLMRDFVVARGAKAMLRGLRAVTDFDYEFQLAGMNRSLMPDVETVFLTPSEKYQFISSTFVREIATLGGEVDKFVDATVAQRLAEKSQAIMSLTITEECINCDVCEPECPNQAISLGPEIYQIDPDRCTECVGHFDEPQCVQVCPVACIPVHPQHVESRETLWQKFQRLQAPAAS